jgi:hypothetical protein
MTDPLSPKKMTPLENMARWVECRPIGDQLAAVENAAAAREAVLLRIIPELSPYE